ncbi:hypothetical protein ACEU59_17380 [Buttiauxella noackiae]|uniref:hypothetical protein n=1 Tax=Buttiauxella noackiae TaxID=82992 RepID=UPI0035A599DB
MKIKPWYYILLALLAAGVFLTTIFYWVKYQDDNFTCEGEINIIRDNVAFNALLHFKFNNGKGYFNSLGNLSKDGKVTERLSKALTFNYTNYHGYIIMLSGENKTSYTKENPLAHIVPDFFLYSERGFQIKMIRQNASSYLFLQEETPLFYCTRTNK